MEVRDDLLKKYGLDLEGAVRDLIDEGNWIALLDLSVRFRSYSTLNLLLLFSQACKRGFSPTLVAGYKGWQKLGRHVLKGQRALYIFAPKMRRTPSMVSSNLELQLDDQVVGCRLVGVFDLSQTIGDELPLPPEPALLEADGLEVEGLFLQLKDYLAEMEFMVIVEQLDGVNGFTDFDRHVVKVRSDVALSQQLKTLVHETAHVVLHSGRAISRMQAELEAESCAYLVCRVVGLDSSSYSFPYVARWSQGNVELVSSVAQNVRYGAAEILKCLGV